MPTISRTNKSRRRARFPRPADDRLPAPGATSPGEAFREALRRPPLAMIGVYDAFSATLAARHYPGLFLSGFGFAASHYGLPDVGFIAWTDMLAFVERVRALLPAQHLLVDIDDGYGDPDIASHVVARMERAGASGVVLEDQQRPRRCGHFDGKQILELSQYLAKLRAALNARRRRLVIVARTDADDPAEVERRICAFAEAGADAVLAEAVRDLGTLEKLRARVQVPLVCNQIAGGKTPPWALRELSGVGVGMVIYSTPCLFAAQAAVQRALARLQRHDGSLRSARDDATLSECKAHLAANLQQATLPGPGGEEQAAG